jgi:hypothetical protein
LIPFLRDAVLLLSGLQYDVCLSITDVGKAYKPAIALLLGRKSLYPTLTGRRDSVAISMLGVNPRVRMGMFCGEAVR